MKIPRTKLIKNVKGPILAGFFSKIHTDGQGKKRNSWEYVSNKTLQKSKIRFLGSLI